MSVAANILSGTPAVDSQSGAASSVINNIKSNDLNGGRSFFSLLSASQLNNVKQGASALGGNDLPLLGENLPQLSEKMDEISSINFTVPSLLLDAETADMENITVLPDEVSIFGGLSDSGDIVRNDYDSLKLRNALRSTVTTPILTANQIPAATSMSPAQVAANDIPADEVLLNSGEEFDSARLNEKLLPQAAVMVKSEEFQKQRLLLKSTVISNVVSTSAETSAQGKLDNGIAAFIDTAQLGSDKLFETGKPQLSLYSPGGKADWSANIATQVKWMLSNNLQTAQMRVDPQHLGPMDIKLSMTDGQITVSIGTSHNIVKEALESSASQLRDELEDEGKVAVNIDLKQGTKDQQAESDDAKPFSSNIISHHSDEAGDGSQQLGSLESANIIDFYA